MLLLMLVRFVPNSTMGQQRRHSQFANNDPAVEALYARAKNPIMTLFALEGTKALAESLPVIVNSPHDVDARSKAQYGAWLCGMCLGAVGMAVRTPRERQPGL